MKPFIILIAFGLHTTCLISQPNISSLIGKTNNQQIGIAMQYVWYPVMKSSAGDSLIALGKPITKQMIPLLADSSKGIIAHFILSSIWGKELEDAGWKQNSSVNYQLTKDSSIEVRLRGLKFYESNQFSAYAERSELERNKVAWLNFLKNKTIQ